MKKQLTILATSLSTIALAFLLHACKPDENECNNCETELITSVVLIATDSASGTISTFAYRDPDGDGGNAPTQFDTISLQTQHTYFVELQLLDESGTPVDTISSEVLDEAEDHQVFYVPSNLNGATINYQDADANSMPIGLLTKWMFANSGNGQLQLVLKHQPGIKDGNINTGETDLDLSFAIQLQ